MSQGKIIIYGDEARTALLRGAEKLAKAVVTTLGPKGRNVALDKRWNAPLIVHDGVTVAKDITLPDPSENAGAELLKEAAIKTNDSSGDGTTTATLLAYQILKNGNRIVGFGANPMIVKRGIDKAVDLVIKEIKKKAKPIKTKEEVLQVATVAASNLEIGTLIAEAIEKVGKQGIITAEDGSIETEINYKLGMEFNKGYASSYFITNPDKLEAEIKDTNIIITDEVLTTTSQIVPILETSVKQGENKNIVIICEAIEGEALATLVINKGRGTLNPLAIIAPSFAERKKDVLEDLAILTGATVITKEAGLKCEDINISHIGHADKVWSDINTTKIIGGKGDKETLATRIKSIRNQIKTATSDFEKQKLTERLAKLTGGVAVIRVGAPTEQEMKELKERVIDASGAVKSSLEEGIIPGGGVALFKARQVLLPLLSELKDDERAGVDIVYKALISPIQKIIENAGVEWQKAAIIIHEIENSKEDKGYDVETGTLGNIIEKGIIDPVKVVREALQNAASVAGTMLTMEVLVYDVPDKEKKDETQIL